MYDSTVDNISPQHETSFAGWVLGTHVNFCRSSEENSVEPSSAGGRPSPGRRSPEGSGAIPGSER